MLKDRIKERILAKFKAPLEYPQQCEALAMAIQEATGQTLGVTTLKRMLGFVKGADAPRRASLDIIAQYLGYPNYSLLAKDLGEDSDISDFEAVESIDSADLEVGEQVRIAYQPNRTLLLSYLGENKYRIDESHGSKLQEGDIVMIAGFYVGFELLISDVERGGNHLGAYQAAKQGGLTSVEIV
ncbi:MAG: hypothetical protein K2N10_02615 [Muribaculaceae bacterium]|nr:hypothetical protein [Muribaculaceae bacterium]